MDNQKYYGYGQQYPQPRQQRQPPWMCVPVSCREEAVAVQMDYMYAGILMPDLAHNAVYAKIVNPNTINPSEIPSNNSPRPIPAKEFPEQFITIVTTAPMIPATHPLHLQFAQI